MRVVRAPEFLAADFRIYFFRRACGGVGRDRQRAGANIYFPDGSIREMDDVVAPG